MKIKNDIKKGLYKVCEENIERRISTILETFKSIEDSKNSETKSSVGDKYETGRAMLQLEEEKSKRQLYETKEIQNNLLKIDLDKKSETIELGSLVSTNTGEYYLSMGIGKVTFEDKVYYCISTKSPIGAKLMGKETGDSIEFNGSKIEIEGVC